MKLIIRAYTDADCATVCHLFYQTVHGINAKDYSAEQLAAWANSPDSLIARRNDLLNQNTLIAETGGAIVGFGSIDHSGCLGLLYVHKNYQNRGIATALCNELEKGYSAIKTYASVTAKPFFESRGYTVVKAQEVERFGVKLKNFEMIKKNAT